MDLVKYLKLKDSLRSERVRETSLSLVPPCLPAGRAKVSPRDTSLRAKDFFSAA
jgi:hypothetical protein